MGPHSEAFAADLSSLGDVEGGMTELLNRVPVATLGTSLSLRVGSAAHIVDVVSLSGHTQVRCGVPGVSVAAAPVDARGFSSRAVPHLTLLNVLFQKVGRK